MESIQTPRSLFKATAIAAIVAIITLVTVILPAEYNIDPTGAGKALGLTAYSQATQLEAVSNGANELASSTKAANGNASQSQSVLLTVPAGKGIEYKLAMAQFAKVNYEWQVKEGELYVDLHGEPQGDTTGYFESYTIATVKQMKGSFTTPFAGSHGWYWKNNSKQDVQVQLFFEGDFVIEGLK